MSNVRTGLGLFTLLVFVSLSGQFIYTWTWQRPDAKEISNIEPNTSTAFGEVDDIEPIISTAFLDSPHLATHSNGKTVCIRKPSSDFVDDATHKGIPWQDVIKKFEPFTEGKMKIALGGAITSKGLWGEETNHQKELLFSVLLPSFCNTASAGYEYYFYFGYDQDDKLATRENQVELNETFMSYTAENCPANIDIGGLHLVYCNYSGKPAWAQNDAMMTAYWDGMDFFYRINDDSSLASSRWTEYYISALATFQPPFIGLAGPMHDIGPQKTMTHEFVHRSHMDIFGFYYPRCFADWYGDSFMNFVYEPDRCVQLSDVMIKHRESLGERYKVINRKGRNETKRIAAEHKTILLRYVENLNI